MPGSWLFRFLFKALGYPVLVMSSPSRSLSRSSKVSSPSGSLMSGRRNSRRRKSKSENKSLLPDEEDYTDSFDFKVRWQKSPICSTACTFLMNSFRLRVVKMKGLVGSRLHSLRRIPNSRRTEHSTLLRFNYLLGKMISGQTISVFPGWDGRERKETKKEEAI